MSLTMPHNAEAEQALLGRLMIDGSLIRTLEVRSSDFFTEQHSALFEVISAAAKRGSVTLAAIADAMESGKLTQACGGMLYAAQLRDECGTTVGAEHYSGILRTHANRRAIIAAATDIATRGYDQSVDLDDYRAQAESALLAATSGDVKATTRTMGEIMDSVWRDVEERRKGGRPRGIDIGLQPLQNITGRWMGGQLIVLGGTPGAGKTALAANIVEHVAETQGPVAMFSCEMKGEELGSRWIAARSGVSGMAIAQNPLSQLDAERVLEACTTLQPLPVVVEDNAGAITTQHVGAVCRRMKSRQGLSLAVVDYLQLMPVTTSARVSREQQVAELSRSLKYLATELDVPFLVLSQLNRASDVKDRPTERDFRESGAIEQDAHKCIILWSERPEKGKEHTGVRRVEAIVCKNRGGPKGTAIVAFNEKLTKFGEWTERQELGQFV